MKLPTHAAVGGIIGQIIMPGWKGFLIGSVASVIVDAEVFFPNYIPQLIKYRKIIKHKQVEIQINKFTHSLFIGLLIVFLASTMKWQPVILIIGLSFLSHWLIDAISHRKKANRKPDYPGAFWPLPNHVNGLYHHLDETKDKMLYEIIVSSIIWLAVGTYAVLF